MLQQATFSEEQIKLLVELGIEPLALLFYPPGFVHPKILDPDNYVPPSRKGFFIGLPIITAIVTTIFVGLKFTSRKYVLYRVGWEDVLLLFAWALGMGTITVTIWSAVNTCMGFHIYDCTIDEIRKTYQFQYAMWILSSLAVGVTRSAILIFLWNLAPVTEGAMRRIIIFLHLLNLGSWALLVFPIIFQCYPQTMRLWEMEETLSCINPEGYVIGKLAIASSALAAALDFTLLLLPIRLVFRLNISLRKRIAISSIFGIGLMACIASGIRTYFVGRYFTHIIYLDFSWDLIPAVCAYYAESMFGMIAACIPSIKAAHGTLTNRTTTNLQTRSSFANLTLESRRAAAAAKRLEGDVLDGGSLAERCSISVSGQSHNAHELGLQSHGTSTLHLNPQGGGDHEVSLADVQLQILKPIPVKPSGDGEDGSSSHHPRHDRNH